MREPIAFAMIISAIVSLADGQAYAQSLEQPSQPAAETTEIAEVVVTAQRREQSLQTVPVAVSVISGTAALESGISDTATLSAAVPGLDVDYEGASTTLFLRGVG